MFFAKYGFQIGSQDSRWGWMKALYSIGKDSLDRWVKVPFILLKRLHSFGRSDITM